jgi:CrcB protein
MWIALGSALGGMLRFWLGSEITGIYGSGFPWGTWAVNAAGSFLIGIASNWADHTTIRFFLIIGFCGGFTTFSSFSLETLALLKQGAWQKAAAYVTLSVLVCVACTLAGAWLGRIKG